MFLRFAAVLVFVLTGLAGCSSGVVSGYPDDTLDTENSLDIEVSELRFPQQPATQTSAALPVVIRNKQNRRSVELVAATADAPFAVVPFAAPVTLAPRASTTIYVTFSPPASGLFEGVLTCTFGGGAKRTYPLRGRGVGSADTQPPTIALTAPEDGVTVTDAIAVDVVAVASDNVGVARVDFYDGATLIGSDMTPPFGATLGFAASDNGVHTITARAHDAAGNTAISSARTLTVAIGGGPTSYSATLAWDANSETDLEGYLVYMRVGASGYGGPIATVTQPTYRVTGLASGTYGFRVTAINDAGRESAPSAEVSRTFP